MKRGKLELVVDVEARLEPTSAVWFPRGVSTASIWHHERGGAGRDNYAGPSFTRETGTFLNYVISRYENLPDAAVFVHHDVGLHNPVWLRWLACVRSSASFVSLSPVIARVKFTSPVVANRTALLRALDVDEARLSNLSGGAGDEAARRHGSPTCCFTVLLSRAAILRLPLRAYQRARAALRARESSPFDFELQFHLLFPASFTERAGAWRDVCEHFMCEKPQCSTQHIRYFSETGPFTRGHARKHAPTRLLEWEEGSCGVTDLASPEWRRVSEHATRETLQLPCGSGRAETDAQLCDPPTAESGGRAFARVVPGYAAHIRRGCAYGDARCAKNASYGTHQPDAKTAASAGPAMCAIFRCWLRCCAACAARRWCVAWEWDLPESRCRLSASPPGMAAEPSRRRVVGMPMPPLEAAAREWQMVDGRIRP